MGDAAPRGEETDPITTESDTRSTTQSGEVGESLITPQYGSNNNESPPAIRAGSRSAGAPCQRDDGTWAVVDGKHDRPGGARCINDVRGSRRDANVAIYPDQKVMPITRTPLEVPSSSMNLSQLAACELLTAYGSRYWQK
jgi:hypothetical protein